MELNLLTDTNAARRKKITDIYAQQGSVANNTGKAIRSTVGDVVDAVDSANNLVSLPTRFARGAASAVVPIAADFGRGLLGRDAPPPQTTQAVAQPIAQITPQPAAQTLSQPATQSLPVAAVAQPITANVAPQVDPQPQEQKLPERTQYTVENQGARKRIDQLSKPIDSIDADKYRDAKTPLGGFAGAMLALGGINKLNQNRQQELRNVQKEDQRTIGNDFAAFDQSNKTYSTDANVNLSNENANLTSKNALGVVADTESKNRLATLQQDLLNETDPDKAQVKRDNLLTIMGKYREPKQEKYTSLDYDTGEKDLTGQPIFKRGAFNNQTGEFVSGPKQKSSAPPAGYKQIGTSSGKPVYEDKSGKRFIGE